MNKLKEVLEKYINWVFLLPSPFDMIVAFISIGGPIFAIIFYFSVFAPRQVCLNSEMPRRWDTQQGFCEEYQDGQWIEVDDSKFIYNESAKEK